MTRNKVVSKSKAKSNRKTRRGKSKNLPAAIGSTNRPYYKTVSTSANSCRVKGYDMVSSSLQSPPPISEDMAVFSVITANPAYWTGTRVASIASSYSQYRPLKFVAHFYPQVATTSNGLVTAGTLWNTDVRAAAFQQTLATSNGGRIYPVYSKAKHFINLKTALPRNMFDIAGYLDSKTNPFNFIACSFNYVGIVPGYYMIEWEYEFKNPVGESNLYESRYIQESLQIGQVWESTTIIPAYFANGVDFNCCDVVKVTVVDNAMLFTANGKVIKNEVPGPCFLFRSRTGNQFDNSLLINNLPEIEQIALTFTNGNVVKNVQINDPLTKVQEIVNRDTPYTGYILYAEQPPQKESGWWPSIVVKLIQNQTVNSLTDYRAFIFSDGPDKSVGSGTAVGDIVYNVDGSTFTTTDFAGSVKMPLAATSLSRRLCN